MPQCIMRFHEGEILESDIPRISEQIRDLVLEVTTTEEVPFSSDDIECIPTPYHPHAQGVPKFSVEIRTYGFPERKKKLNKQSAFELKDKILAIPGVPNVYECEERALTNNDKLVVWVQWLDIDGAHV